MENGNSKTQQCPWTKLTGGYGRLFEHSGIHAADRWAQHYNDFHAGHFHSAEAAAHTAPTAAPNTLKK